MKKAQVLVVGGGFAGLEAAKELDRLGVSCLVADKNAHHLFQPLLYQVACAGLSATSIAAPLRHALKDARLVQVARAEVSDIDPAGRRAELAGLGWMEFDAILLCAGSVPSYFGKPEWERHAPSLKTLEDAMRVRSKVLGAFEEAEKAPEGPERDAWMTFAIVGGGPTGVELAGSLVEIARDALPGEFRSIDPSRARVVVVEGSKAPLAVLGPKLSERAASDLREMGVELLVEARATGIDERGLSYLKDGAPGRLEARTVIWAAGVAASPLVKMAADKLGLAVDRGGRVEPLPDLSLPGAPRLFVAGDLASVKSAGAPVPGLAPAAKQMGRQAARNIAAAIAGRPTEPFVYADQGSLATIGRHKAVVKIGRFEFGGYSAWAFWLFVHIFFLIGWRNRAMVMTDWAWAYLTKQRWARVAWGSGEAPS